MKLVEIRQQLECISNDLVKSLKRIIGDHQDIIIIGNGGSNSIASHIAQDYTKQLKKRCLSFSDPSRLTCYINDYGMENAYTQFIKEFSTNDSLVILISSSGNSPNIYNATTFCAKEKIPFIILTGFRSDNKVRKSYGQNALLEYWVNSENYGVVECMHQIFLHTAA